MAAAKDQPNTINIYSTVGDYGDGQGVTPRLVSSVLRNADGEPVIVNINSPGGDFFDGLAIHTLLSQYKGDVTINIIGMAASAASIIALAGDTINIAKAGFFMIHNSWSIAIGNRHDFEAASELLAQFDSSMTILYADSTGLDQKTIAKMMDAETWIQGEDAVTKGFAHAMLGDDKVKVEENPENGNNALRRIDTALAKAGMPRSARRELIKEITSMPRAAGLDVDMPGADHERLTEALAKLREVVVNAPNLNT